MQGASAQLTEATAEHSLRTVLAGRARVNPEAGDSAGVVSLIVDDATQTDTVIGDVLAHLRDRLPAAQFQAVSADAPDYLGALTEMRLRRERDEVRLDLPATGEFPFATPCRLCRAAPAVARVRLGEGDEKDACADCRMRHSWEARRAGESAERELAGSVGQGRPPDEFSALALLGAADTDRNHLATVYADGNGIGDFFDRVARLDLPAGSPTRAGASKALSEHTRAALTHAAQRATHDGRMCVIPHVVGGDDILVTLPADRAWTFTRTFLADLCTRLAGTARDLGIPAPTVSAGIVIAHARHPFYLVVEEATAGLKRAKRAVAGTAASVQLHDVTVDGVDGTRMPGLRLDTVESAAEDLDLLRAVPQSGRVRLAEVLVGRQGPARAFDLAERLGRVDAVTPFLPKPDGEEPGIALAHALRIVRWWR
ncbi:MAG: hypothetical protein JWN52_2792 [Actinomycetia bacterium]|nr:hypothetical protein [Actinomycetes bacterium]